MSRIVFEWAIKVIYRIGATVCNGVGFYVYLEHMYENTLLDISQNRYSAVVYCIMYVVLLQSVSVKARLAKPMFY